MKSRLSIGWHRIKKEKWLIALCLILGFLSWQGIRRDIGFEDSVSNVSVEVDLPEGWAVWEKSVHRANIEFRGSREDIRYLKSTQLRIVIPVAEPKKGVETRIKLSEKYLRNPTRAKAVRFSPSEVIIKLDQESERLLPVKAIVTGSLQKGLEIEQMVCTPAFVQVTGSRQVLENMKNIHTESIDLSERKASFKESVPVTPPQTGRIRVNPDWVSVDFKVVERSSTKEFNSVPVRVLCSPNETRRVEIQPQIISIKVKGQQQRLEQVQASDIFAYVSCTKLSENTRYDRAVIIDLPAGLKLIETDPEIIHISIGNPK